MVTTLATWTSLSLRNHKSLHDPPAVVIEMLYLYELECLSFEVRHAVIADAGVLPSLMYSIYIYRYMPWNQEVNSVIRRSISGMARSCRSISSFSLSIVSDHPCSAGIGILFQFQPFLSIQLCKDIITLPIKLQDVIVVFP